MEKDFTMTTYGNLVARFTAFGYDFQTLSDFVEKTKSKSIIMRHDVDRLPGNALQMAQMENKAGIAATYYFRAVRESWDVEIIQKIGSLGHEVGYHYENIDTVMRGQRTRGRSQKPYAVTQRVYGLAYEDFKRNLERLRKLAPVSTVCMHGSPLTGVDNLALLKEFDYKGLGLVAEPYIDVDFDHVFYLTDTGRRWDGWKVSVRDKMPQQEQWVRQGLVFHSTWEIIRAAESGILPDKIMITVHPQRWTDDPVAWVKELILQSTKNIVKRWMIRYGKNHQRGFIE